MAHLLNSMIDALTNFKLKALTKNDLTRLLGEGFESGNPLRPLTLFNKKKIN
jgi:hypothetical protein